MKTNQRKSGRPAFTLIELMAVVTIIILLAGLVIGGVGYVNDRQATAKAKTQIALLEKGLEEFKLEYGFYPPAKRDLKTKSIVPDTSAGAQNINAIYKALFWDTDFDGVGALKSDGTKDDEDQPNFLNELNPNMVDGKITNKQGWIDKFGAAATIRDPWGKEYGYRRGDNSAAQNPDFDLWSVGKDGETDTDLTKKPSKDDIRNF